MVKRKLKGPYEILFQIFHPRLVKKNTDEISIFVPFIIICEQVGQLTSYRMLKFIVYAQLLLSLVFLDLTRIRCASTNSKLMC